MWTRWLACCLVLGMADPDLPEEQKELRYEDIQAIADVGTPRVAEAPAFERTQRPGHPVRARDWSRDPIRTVWAVLDGFQRRSETDYVAPMAEEFVFFSDDPDFVARHPAGMSKADELAFATHLFLGGAQDPDGNALPIASDVALDAGPMRRVSGDAREGVVRVLLGRMAVTLRLADGTTRELGGTRAEFELTRTVAGWRVRSWRERHWTPGEEDSLAARLTAASAADDGKHVAASTADPLSLALRVRSDRGRAALVFDVVLPRPGGALEMFDVAGRRIARRDLVGVGAGRHTLALDGSAYPAGVYLVRLRQPDDARTAKLVWAP